MLNDNDVNRIFGWAIFRVKNKYKKLINKGSDNKLFHKKSILLNDMSVESEGIICNEYYVRTFNSLNDRMRSNGKLNLIHQSYCKLYSILLKDITSISSNRRDFLDEVIPNKDDIVAKIKTKMTSNDIITVRDIVNLMIGMNPLIKLKHDNIHDLVYELSNRV